MKGLELTWKFWTRYHTLNVLLLENRIIPSSHTSGIASEKYQKRATTPSTLAANGSKVHTKCTHIPSCIAVYVPVQCLCMEELNPIGIITALFVVVEGFRESSGSHIFGRVEGVRGWGSRGVTLWEGLCTKELPTGEDSDKSKQISAHLFIFLWLTLSGVLLKCTTRNNGDPAFFPRRYSKVNPAPMRLFQTSVCVCLWTKG